MVNDLYDATLC